MPNPGFSQAAFIARFESRISKGEGCWLWTGHVGENGYGYISRLDNYLLAHRVSYEHFVGPIPDGVFVCHRCDNPRCVRPDHLFLGTQADNLRDMVAKGRHGGGGPKGERCLFATLSEAQVREIRSAVRLPGESDNQCNARLATAYSVSRHAIYGVRHRRTWKHLP